MANRLLQTYKQACMTGTAPDLTDGNVKAVLVDVEDHTPDTTINGDEFLSDIVSGARIAITAALPNPTVVDGQFRADNTPLPDTGGDEAEVLYVFHDTGVEGTSRLIALIDTAGGLPVQRDNVEDNIVWPDPIFSL